MIKTEQDTAGDAAQMRGADAIVRVLAAHGVDRVFGYPGGAIMPLYDALYDSQVKHVLTRHEQGAAFAALGYARASGKTGVCIATSGPGATNLITGLADALLDSVPVVAITGQVASSLIGTDAFQEIDVLGMSLSCTKHSFQVTDVEALIPTLYRAFSLAAEGRPGPVLVDIAKDVQLAPLSYRRVLQPVQHMPKADSGDIDRAKALLGASRRPMLYIGGGVGMAGAVDALRSFMAQTRLPSVCTLKGLGSVTPDDPLYLGMLGMHGLKAANLAVQQCDLLLAVGARFDDRVTGRLAAFAPRAKVIHLDIDPAEFGKLRQPDVALCGDLNQLLPALTQSLVLDDWRDEVVALKQQYQQKYHQQKQAICAPALLNALSQRLQGDTVVSCDVGQHQMWVAQHMQFSRPENLLSSAGLGTMGFGLPAAIGAQFARPQATVVAVSGDGSFMMNVQELATIKRMGLPVKILLLDNGKLGMVKQWQQLFFDGRLSETDLSDNPDFVQLAAAFGIRGHHISRGDEVSDGLDALLQANGAYLLHVSIDNRADVWPLVPPGAANQEMLDNGGAQDES